MTKTRTRSLCEAENHESMLSTLGNVEKVEGQKQGSDILLLRLYSLQNRLPPFTSTTTSKETTTSKVRIIVKWLGHSSYEIRAGDKIIYIDRVQNIFKSIA